MTTQRLSKAFERLVLQSGYGQVRRIESLEGGRNNRVYRLETSTVPLFGKHYFRHPSDNRDRLNAEFAFAQNAWKRGIRSLPEPLACDANLGLGVFEFVDGRRMRAGEVMQKHVEQAIDFICDINQDFRSKEDLPAASEACFRFSDHLAMLKKRTSRLELISGEGEIHAEAARFVRDTVVPHASELIDSMQQYDCRGVGGKLTIHDRIVSPSDFGFHNALVQYSDGKLRFFDFEYAGVDDPAKLVCDFFCQPQVPVPMAEWNRVVNALAGIVEEDNHFRDRAERLLPVYQLKWVCIRLNDFLCVSGERRRFAIRSNDVNERLRQQLDGARAAMTSLMATASGIR